MGTIVAVLLTMMWPTQNAMAGEFEDAGLQLCSDVIESYRTDPSTTSDVYFDWAEGFMSGLNVARLNDTTAFKSMTAEQQEAHIRSFCEKHPSENTLRQ